MPRIVSGPAVGGVVVNKNTGAPLSGVTVTPSAALWSDLEFQNAASTLTTKGDGSFAAYASPGIYTFTCSDTNAAAIESVEVLSSDLGTNAAGSGSGGAQGSQGNQGSAGAQGTQGAAGTQGTAGAQGTQGHQGFQGTSGSNGTQGFQGTAGSVGTQGNQGAAGSNGTQGNQGFQGTAGTGTQGTQGTQGTTGAAQPYTRSAVGNASTAQTIPAPTTDQMMTYTLNSTTCAFTTPTAVAGTRIIIVLTQDATGGRLATWTTVDWGTAGAPVLSTAAAARDYITIVCSDGTHWDGFFNGSGF